jgi:hypothetical protein
MARPIRTPFSSRNAYVLRIGVFLAVLVFSAFVLLRLVSCEADDAYIHERISSNLVRFGVPWFNPSDRVMSTSAPVWTLLLAGLMRLAPSHNLVPLIEALAIATVCACGLVLASRALCSSNCGPAAAAVTYVATILFSVCSLLPAGVEQMETPFALAVAVVAIVWLDELPGLSLALLVVAGFTRYELFGLLLFAALYVMLRGKLKSKTLLPPALVFAAIAVWLQINFHAMIPNSVKAKKVVYVMPHRPMSATLSPVHMLGQVELALFAVLAFYLVWAARRGVFSPYKKHSAGILLFAFGGALWFVYLVERAFIFEWYRPLVLVPLCLGAVLTVVAAGRLWGSIPAILLILLIMPISIPAGGYLMAALRDRPSSAPGYENAARVHTYLAVGNAIDQACPGATLMTSEIGALGHSFHGYIYDGVGLTNPDALKYHPMKVPQERRSGTVGAIPVGYVMEKNPDVIVSYDTYAEALLRSSAMQNYVDHAYPIFLPADPLQELKARSAHRALHVMVRADGHCDTSRVQQEVAQAYE